MREQWTKQAKHAHQQFRRRPLWQQLAMAGAGVLLLVWLIWPSGDEESLPEGPAMRIVVTPMQAEQHRRQIVIYGSTQPDRDVNLSAQASGEVIAIAAEEGAQVSKGDIILKIDPRERPERLAEAKAVLRQREIEFEAARKLQKSGFQSEIALAEAKARLEQARAQLKQIRLDVGFTELTAPFDGLLEVVNVEEGDFVGIGTFGVEGPAARVVDLDPLLATGALAEQDRAEVTMGETVTVRLAGGQMAEGIITYLANVADAQSRTFALEAEIPNENYALPAGVTAEIRVPGRLRASYRVPASVLALNDAGRVGVKRLDADNIVHFEPVDIIEEDTDGLWIALEPEQMRLITTGQAYVSDGQVLPEKAVVVE